jgi:hypothetical protein
MCLWGGGILSRHLCLDQDSDTLAESSLYHADARAGPPGICPCVRSFQLLSRGTLSIRALATLPSVLHLPCLLAPGRYLYATVNYRQPFPYNVSISPEG